MAIFEPVPNWRAVIAGATYPGGMLMGARVMALAIQICPRNKTVFGPATSAGLPLYLSHFRVDIYGGEVGWRIQVGAKKPYAYFVHQGTRPHEILPVNASVLYFYWPKKGSWVAFKHVSHPGTRPQPWLWEAANVIIRSGISV